MDITHHLDRAIAGLRRAGLSFSAPDTVPILPLLERIKHYDLERTTAVAATLQQSAAFNDAVRQQISGMDIATRYAEVTDAFSSIRDDAVAMAGWMADGRLDMKEKLQLGWMRVRRGSIPDRFESIRAKYLEVAVAANGQLAHEEHILTAYQDFRLALKAAEVDAQHILQAAQGSLDKAKAALASASEAVESCTDTGAQRATLELERDQALRALQEEDKSFQIAKDLADDLRVSYNTAELVFARLQQARSVKERLYQRAVSFFATNEVVFTGLAVSFTSMSGLDEATKTMDAMKDGMSDGLDALAGTSGDTLKNALRSGYGSTLRTTSVAALANAIVDFQASSTQLIAELRQESTKAAADIEAAAEAGKRRFAATLIKSEG